MKQTIPLIVTVYIGRGKIPEAIVVGAVIWGGACKPQAEPVEMPEIY
jgi:hypothetical protein